jgi:hypothetical protein
MNRPAPIVCVVAAALAVPALAEGPDYVRFPDQQRLHATGGGLVVVRARCAAHPGADDCRGDVRLFQAVGEFGTGHALSDRGPFQIAAGRRGRMYVQLTRRAQRALERSGGLDARAVIYAPGAGGRGQLGGLVEVLAPCPGAGEFDTGC